LTAAIDAGEMADSRRELDQPSVKFFMTRRHRFQSHGEHATRHGAAQQRWLTRRGLNAL
jgi:hypothetical protein